MALQSWVVLRSFVCEVRPFSFNNRMVRLERHGQVLVTRFLEISDDFHSVRGVEDALASLMAWSDTHTCCPNGFRMLPGTVQRFALVFWARSDALGPSMARSDASTTASRI